MRQTCAELSAACAETHIRVHIFIIVILQKADVNQINIETAFTSGNTDRRKRIGRTWHLSRKTKIFSDIIFLL